MKIKNNFLFTLSLMAIFCTPLDASAISMSEEDKAFTQKILQGLEDGKKWLGGFKTEVCGSKFSSPLMRDGEGMFYMSCWISLSVREWTEHADRADDKSLFVNGPERCSLRSDVCSIGHGLMTVWDPKTKKKIAEGELAKGRRIGEWTFWDGNGGVKKAKYVDGKRQP